MKDFFLISFLTFINLNNFAFDTNKFNKKECILIRNKTEKLFRDTMIKIINIDNLGDTENLDYGEISDRVFDLIYKKKYKLDFDKKIELLVGFIYFQKHYLGAYYNCLLSDEKMRYTKSNESLLIFFSPFEQTPFEIRSVKFDIEKLKSKISDENKDLINAIILLNEKDLEKDLSNKYYNELLQKYVSSYRFKTEYFNAPKN
jgi:hypothetical protein